MESRKKSKPDKEIKTVEDVFRKFRNPRNRVEQINKLSERLQNTQPLEAAHIAQIGVQIADEKDFADLKAICRRRAGLCFYYAGAFRESLDSYSESLKYYELRKDIEGTASVLQNIGLVLRRLERHQEALEVYQRSADLFAKTENVTARQYVLINIASLATHLYDPVRVIATYSECLQTLEKHDDDFIRAVVTGNLGRLFIDLGDYERGAEYTKKSAELHEKRGDFIGIGHATGSMAFIEKHRGNLNRALELFNESVQAYKKANHSSGYAAALSNVAEIALSEKMYDVSFKYAQESLTEYVAIGDNENEARVLRTLAKLESECNSREKAFFFISSAIEKLNKSVNYGLLANTWLACGQIHERFQEYEKAIESYLKGYEMSELHNLDKNCYMAAENLSALYEKCGDYFSALRYSRLFQERKSSFDKSINSLENQGLRYRLEIEKFERETEVMRLKNENLQAQLQSQVNELNTTAMALAQKNDVLGSIVNSLKKVTDLKNAERTKAIHNVINEISGHIRSDKNRKHLTEKLQDQQRDFIERLTRVASDLSAREIQICSMIRLNLSSKEISDLLCINEKSVEIYRHRIRAKLALASGTNLTNHLSSL